MGIPSYWLVDIAEPAVRVLELLDGDYVEHTRMLGDTQSELERPFAVTFAPADLI